MSSSYLTIAQAALDLHVTSQTVRRRVYSGLLPALWLGPRILRVEARAVHRDAPPLVPGAAAHIGVGELAEAWALHPRTVHALASAGLLPGRVQGGRWAFLRSDLERVVAHLSTGRREAA